MTSQRLLTLGAFTVALGLGGPSVAQVADEDRVLSGFFNVDVTMAISNLTENTGAIVVECFARSPFGAQSAGTGPIVGLGKVVVHGGMFEEIALRHDSGEEIIENLEFVTKRDVFGYGGTRGFSDTVRVVVGSIHDPSRLEEWTEGTCDMTLIGADETRLPEYDEFEGEYPQVCQTDGSVNIMTCVRPGRSADESDFSFRREF